MWVVHNLYNLIFKREYVCVDDRLFESKSKKIYNFSIDTRFL